MSQALIAHNGDKGRLLECVIALENGDFDLLVSDVQMPGLDGFELTRRVRSDARLAQLPVVLVTAGAAGIAASLNRARPPADESEPGDG